MISLSPTKLITEWTFAEPLTYSDFKHGRTEKDNDLLILNEFIYTIFFHSVKAQPPPQVNRNLTSPEKDNDFKR